MKLDGNPQVIVPAHTTATGHAEPQELVPLAQFLAPLYERIDALERALAGRQAPNAGKRR